MNTDPLAASRWLNPFKHCGAGLHIGPMEPQPHEFGSVLTLAAAPGHVPDDVRHRHLPLSYQHLDRDVLDEAVIWTLQQFEADRTVLIRSEGGKERPALVVGACFLRLGGDCVDAVSAISRADPLALRDFRYRRLLREMSAERRA